MAQIGVGYPDAVFTLVGGLGGSVAYSYAEPTLSKTFMASGAGKLILSDVLGISYWTGALVPGAICVVILILLERSFPLAVSWEATAIFRQPDTESPGSARCLPNERHADFGSPSLELWHPAPA